MDKSLIGLTGEYYVLAQLTARGLIATLTLSNTKGIDILVTNQEANILFKVEVKTTNTGAKTERLFGDKKIYSWAMGEKHEKINDLNLYYVFVVLRGADKLPHFFVVPSKEVAKYVKWQHKHWLRSRKNKVKDTTMRRFRISIDDPNGYRNNWSLFLK